MGKSGAILLMGVGVIMVYAAYTGRAQAAWSALTGNDAMADDDAESGNPRMDATDNQAGEGGPRGQLYVNAAGRSMISSGAVVGYS